MTKAQFFQYLVDILGVAENSDERHATPTELALILTAVRNAYVEHAAGVPDDTILDPVHLNMWPENQHRWIRNAIRQWGEHAALARRRREG